MLVSSLRSSTVGLLFMLLLMTASARAVAVRFSPNPREKPLHSFKGWQIYGRYDKEKETWRFALIRGTNAVKKYEQLRKELYLPGFKGLSHQLRQLATGEQLFLWEPKRGQGKWFDDLPEPVVQKIRKLCRQYDLEWIPRGKDRQAIPADKK